MKLSVLLMALFPITCAFAQTHLVAWKVFDSITPALRVTKIATGTVQTNGQGAGSCMVLLDERDQSLSLKLVSDSQLVGELEIQQDLKSFENPDIEEKQYVNYDEKNATLDYFHAVGVWYDQNAGYNDFMTDSFPAALLTAPPGFRAERVEFKSNSLMKMEFPAFSQFLNLRRPISRAWIVIIN